MGMIARIDRKAEAISIRASPSPRDSGTKARPATMTMAITGRLIRNTDPHQKCSSRNPPTSGPTAAPPVAPADQTAMARVRCSGCRKTSRRIDSVEGMMVAPNNPRKTRAAIRTPAVGAKAASSEASPKPAEPISRRRRRPMRSATFPMVTSSPASTKE